MQKDVKKVRANEHIRVPQVRLIGAAGEQIGVVPTREALIRAQTEGLDLVEVAAAVNPPVCRIMDLGKYLYSLSKKEKESRKNQKVVNIKEVKMTSKIEEHDYQTKLRNSRRFIEEGDKVKLSMIFRGREITHMDLGQVIVQRFSEDISDIAELEKNNGLEGNAIQLLFSPLPSVKKSPKSTVKPQEPEAAKKPETNSKKEG